MRLGIAKKLVQRFDDEIVFLKGMIKSPDTVGSIIPSSRAMARIMAQQIDLKSAKPVLELGPGTGVITREILIHGVRPKDLYCVEYSKEFTERLAKVFPNINLINGDAFDLNATLGPHKDLVFDAVVSSMPLLNFPMQNRIELINDLLDRVPQGRPVVLFSYGATPPVPTEDQDFTVTPISWILRNVPPARVWAYSR